MGSRDSDNVEHLLGPEEHELRFLPSEAHEGLAVQALPSNDAAVALDAEPGAELLREGLARDVVRLVQIARREADLHVSDRILLTLECPAEVAEAVSAHEDYLREQTLAEALTLGSASECSFVRRSALGGGEIAVGLERAARASG